MSRDILREYGPDSSQPQQASSSNGGRITPRDVNNYQSPQGPKGIMGNESPSLGGSNHGITNGPNSGGSHSGSPGLGGTNHGCCGSQGKH